MKNKYDLLDRRPVFTYTCPIGRKDPETKHKHETRTKRLFEHVEEITGAHVRALIEIRKSKEYSYYVMLHLSITALGLPSKDDKIRPTYYKRARATEISLDLKRILRQGWWAKPR